MVAMMKDAQQLFHSKGFNGDYRNSAAVLDARNMLCFFTELELAMSLMAPH